MRALTLTIALVACSAAPPAPIAPSQPVPIVVKPAPFTDAVIIGRVLQAGEPVPEFGFAHTKSWTARWGRSPVTTVHQSDGRFRIHVPTGTWDLLIAGRGFARTVLIGKTLRSGLVTDLGDITPSRGFTVAGQVTDAQARPVAHAKVTIRGAWMDEEPVEDSIVARMNGDFVGVADAAGRYQLDGVTALDLRNYLVIRARAASTEASVPENLPAGSSIKDFVVLPTGWIDGVATRSRGAVLVQPAGIKKAIFSASMTDGAFEVRDLPAGDYWVQVAGFPRKLVTVVANQPTAVQFP